MTDDLTIFGKVMECVRLNDHSGFQPFDRYSVHVGTLLFRIVKYEGSKSFQACVGTGIGEALATNEHIRTASDAVDWLESEARRIMRECLEIAGEMVESKESR